MKKHFLAFLTALYSTIVIAQTQGDDTDIKMDTTKVNNAWYSSPWVWVVVAAVFILLLVILTPGNSRRDQSSKK